ncbi:DEAD/DEAH box helicase [Reinekea sp. G2M2-21]|uniref:DEAD/DEAH box helicase n=1 Tax=Reinekea sp. G2M2-21 TaxID=2788942 RepID=UPI0018A9CCFD|nr:DEAD/DEAH box helicase [Reinekea sp. G2M2-21]
MIRTYGNLAFDNANQHWVIEHLEAHVAIRLKRMFPRVATGATGRFELTHSPDTAADILWFTQRYPLVVAEQDSTYLKQQTEAYLVNQAEADRIKLPDYQPTERGGLKKGQVFRGYQNIFLDWAGIVQSGILIDDVGLGKTYSGLGLYTLANCAPLVIICEPHLQKQWYEKAQSFIAGTVHLAKTNKPYDLPPSDVYIFKYTQLAGWVDVLSAGWVKAIAFDEVQQLRHGRNTNKGEAAFQICQVVDIKFGLTATLIYGYGIEAYNIISLFKPDLLGTADEFVREWCDGDFGAKKVVRDPDALGSYLVENNVVLRRRKQDVGQEAKQLKPELYWIDPDEKSVADAEALAEKLAITTLTGSFEESGQAAREFDMRMRELTGISKAKAVAAWVRMFVESGTPVILFGWHREVYRIWNNELYDLKPAMFTGSETLAQKEENKQRFLNCETDVLIMSLRSGSGTDGLQYRCSTAIHGELDPAPNIHVQANGRLDRDGQEDEVFAFYAVTNYGSDPVMLDVLGLKESQGRGIQDPGMRKETQQSDPDRIKRMARAFLKQRKVQIPDTVETRTVSTEDQLVLI